MGWGWKEENAKERQGRYNENVGARELRSACDGEKRVFEGSDAARPSLDLSAFI